MTNAALIAQYPIGKALVVMTSMGILRMERTLDGIEAQFSHSATEQQMQEQLAQVLARPAAPRRKR